jgi:hypothetical protein
MTLNLEIDGVEVINPSTGSSYSLVIEPGVVAADRTVVSGSSLTAGMVVGESVDIILQARDSNGFVTTSPLPDGDTFRVEVTVGDASPTVLDATSIGDGEYRVEYIYEGAPLSDQTITTWEVIYLSADGESVPVETFESTIYPSNFELVPDPSLSTLFLSSNPAADDGFPIREVLNGTEDVQGGKVGLPYYIFLQLKSKEGLDLQKVPEGTELTMKKSGDVEIKHDPVPDKGYYQITLETSAVGKWRIFDLAVNGTSIKVPSFVWHVGGGEVSSTNSYYAGPGSKTARAGLKSTFTIYAKDTFDNELNYDGIGEVPAFRVEVVPDLPSAAAVVPVIDPLRAGSNQYIVSYTPKQAGGTELHVYLGDDPLGTEIFEVGNGELSLDRLNIIPSAQVYQKGNSFFPLCGTPSSFLIFTFDAYENTYTAPLLTFQLTMEPNAALKAQGVSSLVFPSMTRAMPGEYVIDFEVANAGEYSMSIVELVGGDIIVPGPGGLPVVTEFFWECPKYLLIVR